MRWPWEEDIIVYNLSEINPEHPEQALNDTDSFVNIVNNGLGLDGVRASKIYHLGKKQDNKTRPLLVTLDSISMKKTILSKSSGLRKILLRAELKRHKSAGEKNLVIRRGKIVVATENSESASRQINHSASKPTSNWLEPNTQKQDLAKLDIFYTKAIACKERENDSFKVLVMNCQSI